MNPLYPFVALRAAHRCEYCHAPEAIFNFPFEVEHIHPRASGGTDSATNLALACRSCNLSKGSRVTAFDAETQTTVPLFHPRRNVWLEHFQAHPETGLINGQTPTGRATVQGLGMNRANSVAARQLWQRLGLWP